MPTIRVLVCCVAMTAFPGAKGIFVAFLLMIAMAAESFFAKRGGKL